MVAWCAFDITALNTAGHQQIDSLRHWISPGRQWQVSDHGVGPWSWDKGGVHLHSLWQSLTADGWTGLAIQAGGLMGEAVQVDVQSTGLVLKVFFQLFLFSCNSCRIFFSF